MNKRIIAGESAGGGLALQVAYGIQDGTLKAYEPGALAQAKAVVTFFPAGDLKSIWHFNGSLFSIKYHRVNEAYIGGSPQAYPQEYATVDVANHITRNSPPTFIAAGENDHLIPFQSQVQLATALSKMGVPHELISIPFTDHLFLFSQGVVRSQIAFQVDVHFL